MISWGKDSGEGVCSATTGRVVSRRGPPRCVAGRARRRRVVNDARRRRDEARRGREEAEAPSPKRRVGRGEARAVVARRGRSRRPARHLRRHRARDELLPRAQRALGAEDRVTLGIRREYARALYADEKASPEELRESEEILDDLCRTTRRVLGPIHEQTQLALEELVTARKRRAEVRAGEA